jgi:sulfite oxidase
MAPAEPNAKPFQLQGEEEPFFAEELPGWGGYIEWEKVGFQNCILMFTYIY